MSLDSIWFSTLNATEKAELAAAKETILNSTPDLLVVGGGIVGLAVAYFAAELGARVQVIEAGELAGGATGASAGGIFPNVDGLLYPSVYSPLAMLSRDLWGRLSVRPGFDFDWRVPGFLLVDPARLEPSAESFASRHLEEGFSLQAVDGEQVALLEPALSPGIAAGVLYPSEAQLHPVKAALSLARGAARRGCRVRTHARATGVQCAAGKVVSVDTTAGRIEPGHVVVATAASNAWLAPMIDQTWPVSPVSGQMVATAPLPPLLRRPIAGEFLVFQAPTGEVVTGGNELPGNHTTPDPRLSARFAAAAAALVPALRDVQFTRAWCGARPATPDGLPVVDQVADAENLYVNCGHFKKGVLLAPACGKLLAEWVRGGKRPAELEFFSLRRFAGVSGTQDP